MDKSELLSFLYHGSVYTDLTFLGQITIDVDKNVFVEKVNSTGVLLETQYVGNYAQTTSSQDQINSVSMGLDRTLIVETTLGPFSFPEFYQPYNWIPPNRTGQGFKIAGSNTFKPLVSTSPNLTFNTQPNGDLIISYLGAGGGPGGLLGTDTKTEFKVVATSNQAGFHRLLEANLEAGGTYKKLPINHFTPSRPNYQLNPDGSFILPPGRYYVDARIQVRVGRRAKLALFNDVTEQILVHGTGNFNSATTALSIKFCSIEGFFEVTDNSPLSFRVFGFDLGTFYDPVGNGVAPVTVHSLNVYEIGPLPSLQTPLLSQAMFTDNTVYVPMTDYVQNNQIASAHSENSTTYRAWCAFRDGFSTVNTDSWIGGSNVVPTPANPVWLQIEFTDGPRTINKLTLQNRPGSNAAAPTNFKLLGRNSTAEAWTTIIDVVGNPVVGLGAIHNYGLKDPVSFSIYRLEITARDGTLQFVCVARMKLFMADLLETIWPMSTDETSTQLVQYSSAQAGRLGFLAFNGLSGGADTNAWLSTNSAPPTEANPQWLQITYKDGPRTINELKIFNRLASSIQLVAAPVDFKLQGKNDPEDPWTDVLTVVDNPRLLTNEMHRYLLPNPVTFSTFRLLITKAQATSAFVAISLMELNFINQGIHSSNGTAVSEFNLLRDERTHLLDRNNDAWATVTNQPNHPQWVSFYFKVPTVVTGVMLQGRSNAGTGTTLTVSTVLSRDFTLQAWNSTTNQWDDLYVSQDEWVQTLLAKYYYSVTNTTAYTHYRIYYQPTAMTTPTVTLRQLGRLQLYGHTL